MKILFLFALLMNIVFFLWEFNLAPSNVSGSIVTSANNSTKQILLISELVSSEQKTSLNIAKNDKSDEFKLVSTVVNAEPVLEPKAKTVQKDEQPLKEITLLSEKKKPIRKNLFWTEFPEIYLKDDKHTTQIFEKSHSEGRLFDGENAGLVKATHLPLGNMEGNKTDYKNVTNLPTTILEKTASLQVAKKDSKNDVKPVSKQVKTEANLGEPINNDRAASLADKKTLAKITPDTENQLVEAGKNIAQHTTEDLVNTIKAARTEKKLELVGNDQSENSLKPENIINSLHKVNESIKRKNVLKKAELKKESCYEIGPFADHKSLRLWRKSNKINSETFSKFNKKSKVASSFLVYYPPESSLEKFRKITRLYKQNNITDVWLIRRGSLKGAISFGLFTAEIRALNFQKKLLKKGIDVDVMRRYKTVFLPYARVLTKDESFRRKVVITDEQEIKECN